MADGDGKRAIRHSLFAIRHSPSTKGLKTLKTARGSYWLELAPSWDRRHVRLGSAPHSSQAGICMIRGPGGLRADAGRKRFWLLARLAPDDRPPRRRERGGSLAHRGRR